MTNGEVKKITQLFIRFLKKNNLMKLCEFKQHSFLLHIPSHLRTFEHLLIGDNSALKYYGQDMAITITDHLPIINRTLTIKYDKDLLSFWDIGNSDTIMEHWEIRTIEQYYVMLLYTYFLHYLKKHNIIRHITLDFLKLKNNIIENIEL